MILTLLASLSLLQSPTDTLDELRLISSQLTLGQTCEAIERTTINWDVIGPYGMAVIERGEGQGISKTDLNDAQEQGAMSMLAYLEENYSEGRESANFPKLIEECDTLNRDHSRFYGPFVAED